MKYCTYFDPLTEETLDPTMTILQDVKRESPTFKTTLFAVPKRLSDSSIRVVKEQYGDWVQLAPVGWRWTRGECLAWTEEEATDKLQIARERGLDAPVFLAPSYLLDGETYVACEKLGYIVVTTSDFHLPEMPGTTLVTDQPHKTRCLHGTLSHSAPNFILSLRDGGELTFREQDTFAYPQEVVSV